MAAKQSKPKLGRPFGTMAAYSYDGRLMIRIGSDRLDALQRWAQREGLSTAAKGREILEQAIQAEGLRVKRMPEREE
jgi:hypothetical protein